MTPESLFERHLDWAAGIARSVHRKLPPSFELDDLIQHAHIALWKASEKYEEDHGVPFIAYAHVYVQMACWMSVRRRHYREATHEELRSHHVDGKACLLEALINEEESRLKTKQMKAAVARLPLKQWGVITLHYFQDVPMVRVAPAMGISLTAAYTLRQQALAAMREER